MVILFNGFGNHSNRLFQSIHLEAFCIEHKIKYYNPSFRDMGKYYGIKMSLLNEIFCIIIKVLDKLGIIKTICFDNFNNNDLYYNILLTKKCVLVHGWCFRAHHLTEKFQDYFIKKYRLLTSFHYDNTLLNFISTINKNEYTIIGVHIRKGDYRTFEDGKYYFDDHVYQTYIQRLTKIDEGPMMKKKMFIIFSNEKVNIPENENLKISKNRWYIDHLLMSRCDYLIGPPSTFTLWASYIGKNKYFHFQDNSGFIEKSSFAICHG